MANYSWAWDLPCWLVGRPIVTSFEENWFLSPRSYQLQKASCLGMGLCIYLPFSILPFCSLQTCTQFYHGLCELMCPSALVVSGKCFPGDIQQLWFLKSYLLCLLTDPWTLRKGEWYNNILFRNENFQRFLLSTHCPVVDLCINYFKKQLLCRGLSSALVNVIRSHIIAVFT